MKYRNGEDSSKELLKCFKYNKIGHIIRDYPFLQNKRKSHHHKKIIKVAQSDDSASSSSDEEHIANMCFITIKSENKVYFSNDESNLSYNELHNAFESLYDKFRKLSSKYCSLKKIHICLFVKKDILEKRTYIIIDDSKMINQLEDENKVFKENVDKLNTTLIKFTRGSKIL